MGITNGQGQGLSIIQPPPQVTTAYFINTSPVNIPSFLGIYIAIIDNNAPTTVNLPSQPLDSSIVEIWDGSMNAAINNITVQGNGNNINNPNGVVSSYIIGQNGTNAVFPWLGLTVNAWGVR